MLQSAIAFSNQTQFLQGIANLVSNCNSEQTLCTLTCVFNRTDDLGDVQVFWIHDDGRVKEGSKLSVTKETKEKTFVCRLNNPVSSESSNKLKNPLLPTESSYLQVVLIPCIFLISLGFLMYLHIRKRRLKKREESSSLGVLKRSQEVLKRSQEEIESLQSEISLQSERFQSVLESRQEEIESLQSVLKRSQEEKRRLQTKIESLQSEQKRVQDEQKRVQDVLESRQEEQKRVQDEIESLQSEIRRLQSEIESLPSEEERWSLGEIQRVHDDSPL